MIRKITSLLICLSFLFTQTGFAQAAAMELNLGGYFARMGSNLTADSFRPVHLRYFSYDQLNNSFRVLLDKGTQKDIKQGELKDQTKELLKYFLVGLSLPNDTFWVNLRPDSPDSIIEDILAKTDVGKIMLETDLQLKRDTANFTSPQTIEGKEYWNRLYKKAEELYGTDNVTIPTLTRPWIVPNEIIVRETKDSAYVYKATLKVMLEQDYLKDSVAYSFKDERSKALNEYSSQLIRELVIPKLTKEVNTAKRYAALRQVFYSLVLSRWFKGRFVDKKGLSPSGLSQSSLKGAVPNFVDLINKQDLTNLTSKTSWTKDTYFQVYKKSFAEGEYNIKEPVYTPTGQVIRSYFSGGLALNKEMLPDSNTASSSLGTFSGLRKIVNTLAPYMISATGTTFGPLIFGQKEQESQASQGLPNNMQFGFLRKLYNFNKNLYNLWESENGNYFRNMKRRVPLYILAFEKLWQNEISQADTEEKFVNIVIPALVNYLYDYYPGNGRAAYTAVAFDEIIESYRAAVEDHNYKNLNYTAAEITRIITKDLLLKLKTSYMENNLSKVRPQGYHGINIALNNIVRRNFKSVSDFIDFLKNEGFNEIYAAVNELRSGYWTSVKPYHVDLGYIFLSVYANQYATFGALNGRRLNEEEYRVALRQYLMNVSSPINAASPMAKEPAASALKHEITLTILAKYMEEWSGTDFNSAFLQAGFVIDTLETGLGILDDENARIELTETQLDELKAIYTDFIEKRSGQSGLKEAVAQFAKKIQSAPITDPAASSGMTGKNDLAPVGISINYGSAQELLDKIGQFMMYVANMGYDERILAQLGINNPTRLDNYNFIKNIGPVLESEVQRLLDQRELILTDFNPEQLKAGDVIWDGSDFSAYRHKSFTNLFIFDRFDGSYFGTGIRENNYSKYKIVRAADAKGVLGILPEEQFQSSSAVVNPMIDHFRNMLAQRGADIDGLAGINPAEISNKRINDLDWYLFSMPNNRFLELFIKDGGIVAYGIVTWMPGNTILRFQSFEKSAGKGDYWAGIYEERINQLKSALAGMGKGISIIGVPPDQVISEDQLAKRIRSYFGGKIGWEDAATTIINKIRRGQPLTEAENELIKFDNFPEYYSFGPAANLYINKMNFSIVPTMAAPHKQIITEVEYGLLARLRGGKGQDQNLSDVEIITLMSGRGLIRRLSSSSMQPAAASPITKESAASPMMTDAERANSFLEVYPELRGIIPNIYSSYPEKERNNAIIQAGSYYEDHFYRPPNALSAGGIRAGSPLSADEKAGQLDKAGGIDFKDKAMADATTYKSMGSFEGLNFTLPFLSKAELDSIDLAKEVEHIKKLVSSGIMPESEFTKKVMAAAKQTGKLGMYLEDFVVAFANICEWQEQNDPMAELPNGIKEAMVIIDSVDLG